MAGLWLWLNIINIHILTLHIYIYRLVAALQKKVVESLTPAVVEMLVKGVVVGLGVYDIDSNNDNISKIISEPIAPNELKESMFLCTISNIREGVLHQELLLYLCGVSTPGVFEDILCVRLGKNV